MSNADVSPFQASLCATRSAQPSPDWNHDRDGDELAWVAGGRIRDRCSALPLRLGRGVDVCSTASSSSLFGSPVRVRVRISVIRSRPSPSPSPSPNPSSESRVSCATALRFLGYIPYTYSLLCVLSCPDTVCLHTCLYRYARRSCTSTSHLAIVSQCPHITHSAHIPISLSQTIVRRVLVSISAIWSRLWTIGVGCWCWCHAR